MRFLLSLCFALFALGPLAQARALSGEWCGAYRYVEGGEVAFTLRVSERRGALAGATREPNTFGDPSARELGARIKGARQGDRVSWVKTYDGSGGVSHSLRYSERLDAAGQRIVGLWDLGGVTGPFEVRRCNAVPIA